MFYFINFLCNTELLPPTIKALFCHRKQKVLFILLRLWTGAFTAYNAIKWSKPGGNINATKKYLPQWEKRMWRMEHAVRFDLFFWQTGALHLSQPQSHAQVTAQAVFDTPWSKCWRWSSFPSLPSLPSQLHPALPSMARWLLLIAFMSFYFNEQIQGFFTQEC